jgi:hypothetical protein
MTAETLKRIEKSTAIKTRYAGAGSLGRNRLIAIPLVMAFFALFAIYFMYDMSKTEPGYSMYLYVAIGIALACIVTVVLMQRTSKVKTMASLDDVKACIARTTTGNDAAQIYYCIYTTGNKRHDPEFINSIAYKINHLEEEPDQQLSKKIASMFGPRLAPPNGLATPLPEAFTFGEKVYQKQFDLSYLDKNTRAMITENSGMFPVLVYHSNNAQLVKHEDLANI